MNELSVTVTAGSGSERHNHDINYRQTLENCNKRTDGILELVPYEKSYKEQINELMKPYIDKYNKRVEQRYKLAWERYNSGQIKTKPRKRDYKKMDYDYYSEHIDDTRINPVTKKEEKIPIYRELIIGIGDQNDKQTEKITEQQAINIFGGMLDQFKQDFPDFKILGCSIHLDEDGFYHCHLDYKPLYVRSEASKGLDVGVGLDGALEAMGYEPEQSIINGKDKVPLLFNAMRNKIYYNMEKQMADEQLRLQYGVSKTKDPDKNSSKNQRLKDWQYTQDKVKELQHEKNVAMNIIAGSEVSAEGYKDAIKAFENVERIMDEVEKAERSRLNKNNMIVKYNLFDQMRSFLQELRETFTNLLHNLDIAKYNADMAEKEVELIKKQYVDQKTHQDLKQQYNREVIDHDLTKRKLQKALNESADMSEIIKQHGLEEELRKLQLTKKGPER